MSIDTTIDKRKELPKTEQVFLDYLNGNTNVKGKTQVEISNCPFVTCWKHRVDFVIENNKGERLYVEVKGWMSYSSVNELKYLLEHSGRSFYILQVTNEDWMGLYEKAKHKSVSKKIEANRKAQYEEINDFINGTKTVQNMIDISRQRLGEFVKVREGDLKRWRKRLNEKEQKCGAIRNEGTTANC